MWAGGGEPRWSRNGDRGLLPRLCNVTKLDCTVMCFVLYFSNYQEDYNFNIILVMIEQRNERNKNMTHNVTCAVIFHEGENIVLTFGHFSQNSQ